MRQQGMALVTVLIIVMICSVLLINMLEKTLLQHKMAGSYQQHIQLQQAAEQGLLLGGQAAAANRCLLEKHTSYFFIDARDSWWKSGALCHSRFAGVDVSYAAMRWQPLPCAVFHQQDGAANGGNVYRIISRSYDEKSHALVILQSSALFPAIIKQTCHDNYIAMKAGRQSWAWLE